MNATRTSAQVIHVITGTQTGGAEMVLYRLLCDDAPDGVSVLSMTPPGRLGSLMREHGVGLETLALEEGRVPSLSSLFALRRVMRKHAPDLIQGWMYHGNLAALAGAYIKRPRRPVIWGVHHTLSRFDDEKPMTQKLIKLSARLSPLTSAIVYCSRQSARDHEQLGFASEKTVVIPNGVDCQAFRPKAENRIRLRHELSLGEQARIIGFVGRFHPIKDHPNLIRAVQHLVERSLDVHLALIGAGDQATEKPLRDLVATSGLEKRVSFMGQRDDVASLLGGLDVFCLPSASEAFPMVICEAMATGVPCVVTDVGDAAWIVGETGVVVPPKDSVALAEGLQAMLDLDVDPLRRRGERARLRIESEFPLSKMAASYRDLAKNVLASSNRGAWSGS